MGKGLIKQSQSTRFVQVGPDGRLEIVVNVDLVRSSLIFGGKISGFGISLVEEDAVKLSLVHQTPATNVIL